MAHPRHRELQALIDEFDIDAVLAIVSLDEIAEAWVRYHEVEGNDVDHPDWWAVDLLMADEFDADDARRRAMLLKLAEHAISEDAIGNVGAGPLENFVSDDEDDLRWLEQHCRTSQRLREALSGVWCDGYVTPATMARLDAAAGVALSRRLPDDQIPPEVVALDEATDRLHALLGEDWWAFEETDLTDDHRRVLDDFVTASRRLRELGR